MDFVIKKIGLVVCLALLLLPSVVLAQTAEPSRDELEQQLTAIEQQIADLTQELKTTTGQKQQLQTKIKELKTQTAVLQLKIKVTTITIKTLDKKIAVTETAITKTLAKIKKLRQNLAFLLQILHAQSERGLLVPLLEERGLMAMYDNLQNYQKLSDAVLATVRTLKQTKNELDTKQQELNGAQEDANQMLSIQTIQQQALRGTLAEQNTLLTATKGKETAYQQMLADQKKRAAQIRNRIYELFEANRTVTFGQALEIAKFVEKQTSVRAAFLLAILTQESNLGKNVGTCNRAGDPPEKSWRAVMKPERDQEPFQTITGELGLDIDSTPVSCPMRDKKGNRIGWGGAMGPAQFIPSTWMGYRSKVAALTGKSAANPWDIRDAFTAAGVKLGGNGATGKNGEWKAAMLYFSGSTNPRFRFYADNVLEIAERYETDINTLKTTISGQPRPNL